MIDHPETADHAGDRTVAVDSAGRVVIPADIRRALDIRPGATRLRMRFADGALSITSPVGGIRRAQAIVDRYCGGVDLQDDLRRDRRAEAQREEDIHRRLTGG